MDFPCYGLLLVANGFLLLCSYISYIQFCSINDNDNVSAKLVVGNHIRTMPDETMHANENVSIQHQLLVTESEVDNSESVTLQAEKSHVPEDDGSKERMVGPSHPLADRSANVSMGSVYTLTTNTVTFS